MSYENAALAAPFLFALGSIFSFRYAVTSFEDDRPRRGYPLMILGFICFLGLILQPMLIDFIYWTKFSK